VRVLPLVAPEGSPGAIVVTVDVVGQPEPGVDAGTSTGYHGVVATLTQSVLAGGPTDEVLDTAVRGVSRALDATHVSFVEFRRDAGEIVVLASTAEEANPVASAQPFGSHVGFALQSQRPIVVQDFDAERRFDRGPLAGEQSARSGVCVPVRWRPDGLGAMSVHIPDARRALGSTEVTFVQSAANVCALALQGRDGATTEERP
jgi:GAF domain-containing protein